LKEHRRRRNNLGKAGWVLATTGVALAPKSSLGRLISRSRFRGNAMADARTLDLCNHPRLLHKLVQRPSENLLGAKNLFRREAGEA
jgi:hypothetical protein